MTIPTLTTTQSQTTVTQANATSVVTFTTGPSNCGPIGGGGVGFCDLAHLHSDRSNYIHRNKLGQPASSQHRKIHFHSYDIGDIGSVLGGTVGGASGQCMAPRVRRRNSPFTSTGGGSGAGNKTPVIIGVAVRRCLVGV
ncbi:hypothetical protein M378DRAFT_179397 [Amanita muscaria Koide BX008]|uniref:Uncharacterized protein n=1 Tax=Amanita muscaria (strain Koide BX008) TaxID=946122 RepID=A0A0C2SIW8_AMAMK|nr:hypothetical protein M378DRAFT_179397 [Amanita muscaria Koide BX008]